MTEGGRDVLSFHLHRYLASWLEREHQSSILVTVGYESSLVECATFEASIAQTEQVRVGWTFRDLVQIYRHGDGRLRIEQRQHDWEAVTFDLIPILDEPAVGGDPNVILGFALLSDSAMTSPESLQRLQEKVAEAIRSARRNSRRLFFDDHKSMAIKPMLYALMDRLPEWTGCDHSAAMLMTTSLEAMTLESSDEAHFNVLAERLYKTEDDDSMERLVGMQIDLGNQREGVLRDAVERQSLDPDLPFQVYERRPGEDAWTYLDVPEEHPSWHRLSEERREKMYVLVPLLAPEAHDIELLGFICLAYREPTKLAASAGKAVEELGREMATLLRYSPLFTLNARKLWILQQTRSALTRAITGEGAVSARVEALVGEVTSLIVSHVDVPSFAIAYLRYEEGDDGDERCLRYAHPHGWTHFEQLNLPVDVDEDERLDSGVSSLAFRINKPLVLAGGRGEGDSLAFKNYLYVHEESGRVVDARSHEGASIEEEDGWVRLRDYYKPARSSAYATLAYPVEFDDEPLGMISIEVERDTNWLWWTGFGAQLFWDLLANELAYAFHTMGVGDD
jgi:hypothetical protein